MILQDITLNLLLIVRKIKMLIKFQILIIL